MIKKIIVFLVLSFFVALASVSAIEEGQIITQQQLDGFDVSSVNWQFLECQDENEMWIERPFVWQKYSCLRLYEHGDNYIVKRETYAILSYIWEWKQCLQNYGAGQCWDYYITLKIKPQVRQTVSDIRDWVRDHQTSEEEGLLIDYLQNYTIGDPEQ